MLLTTIRTFDQKMGLIPRVTVAFSILRPSLIRKEDVSSIRISPRCVGSLRVLFRQERTVSSVACAMLAAWFGTTPRTSTALKRRSASRPMRDKVREVDLVSVERPGRDAFTKSATNDNSKTTEESNVFFFMDLFIVFDAPTVRVLLAGMRWRPFQIQNLLVQTVPRYPTAEWQEGNEQPQSGSFDPISCSTMNRTLELSRSPPLCDMTSRFALTSFSSWERASRRTGFSFS